MCVGSGFLMGIEVMSGQLVEVGGCAIKEQRWRLESGSFAGDDGGLSEMVSQLTAGLYQTVTQKPDVPHLNMTTSIIRTTVYWATGHFCLFNSDILNMNGNDERGLDPMDTDRLIGARHAQGNNVASVPNTSHSTFKIDSLSIKLGIVKEKGDAQKCRHFSIRVPQNRAGVAVLPFGEGTSGLKPVDSKNDDETVLSALGASQKANADSPGNRETIDSRVREDPQQTSMVKETVTSPENQPTQQDQHNDYPNGHPRRKTRKVRLLKELLNENSINQQTKENATPSLGSRACSTSAASSQLKRKMLHDQVQEQRPDDVTTPVHASKKAKFSKGNEIAKSNVVKP
ncbi:protein embryonic flower 1 [Tanacetum coccineum]